MIKNWLIRNKDNKIFGPYSKKRILEKYNSNYFSDDDEISQGNGFWFWIREKELVNIYLIEDNIQDPLNPFVSSDEKADDKNDDKTEEMVIENFSNRSTDKNQSNDKKNDSEHDSLNEDTDITQQFSLNELSQTTDLEIEDLELSEVTQATDDVKTEIKKQRDDRFLYLVIFFLVLLLFGVFFYYKNILNRSINLNDITSNFSLIQSAEARVEKKKIKI